MGHSCVICEADDRFDFGLCPSCAATGKQRRLLFVQPASDAGAQRTIESSLRVWLEHSDEAGVTAATRGRQIIAAVPAPLADAAQRTLARAGVPTRSLRSTEWYRALPTHFILMLALVAVVGGFAGLRAVPLMQLTTPLLVVILVIGAWQHVRRPLVRFARTHSALPAAARNSVTMGLSQLRMGRSRELLLDLARVGETTYASLPEPFRKASLGRSVVELIVEAGRLSVETDRLETIALEVHHAGGHDSSDAKSLEQAVAARTALLQRALVLLGRIAREGTDSSEAEMSRLIEQLRTEQQWPANGEAAVESLLAAQPLTAI